MSDMRISPISSFSLQEVLHCQKLTDKQKAEYIRKHETEIHHTLGQNITKNELSKIMAKRPLQRFKPLKNSFTKRGDKILLAKSLDIDTSNVDNFIEEIVDKGFHNLPEESIDKAQTYVYRHGTKKQVTAFLGHELNNADNILKTLYVTLKEDAGEVADYYSRPIHRLDNQTLRDTYLVIDDSLNKALDKGEITEAEKEKNAEWALVRIYQIQNNSKIFRAHQAYEELR